MTGEVLSVELLRAGNAAFIAANGWPCSHPGCPEKVTVEVRFTRRARGNAEDHARSLKNDYATAEG